MWPYLIPAAIGATVSGIQGYQQSGGNLGETLKSAAGGGILGLATGGLGEAAAGLTASRMAGAVPLQMLAKKQAMGLGLTGVEKALLGAPKTVGTAANLGTQLVAAPLLAPLVGGTVNLAGKALGGVGRAAAGAPNNPLVGGGATVAQMQQPSTAELQNQLKQTTALTPELAALNRPISMTDVFAGTGAVARTAEGLERQLQRSENIKDALAYYPIMSQAKKDEMARNMAAAQIRQNIITNADMLQSGYHTAQQIGANAASQLGSALGAQYQYS